MSKLIQPSIVIIGAGAAGMSAATKLISNGLTNVTVLEAENRIGGRVHSVPFGGTVVDLGAQWIHGEDGNIVYDMVKDTGLVGHPQSTTYRDLTFFTSNGIQLDTALTSQLCQIAWEVFEDVHSSAIHGGSLQDFFDREYDRKASATCSNQPVTQLVKEWFAKFYLCMDPADSLEDVSATSLCKYHEVEGDHLIHWKTNGYSSMFEVMMTKTPKFSRKKFLETSLKLNATVKEIHWQQPDQRVEVRCTDGSILHADHVIVTVSLGVLKHCKSLFQPSLPEYKLKCIENIPLGCCHKIMLQFQTAWWPQEVKDFSFAWTAEDKLCLRGESPEGPTHNGRSWLEDVFGFYTVDSHPDILLGWLVGPMTEEVELLPDETVAKASMYLLRRFVGRHYEIAEPIAVLRSTWGTNPNFLGTYSYVGVETEREQVTREDLARPLDFRGKNVVQFAGEATHDKYFSTVHGAVETGFREAERLIESYGSREFHKVVIVGAGMAGLGAATRLIERNIRDFVILEAQARVGGRVKTIFVEGKALDLGAQWMHGRDNPLYRLAKQRHLLSEEVSEEGLGQYVRSNGDVVDPFTVQLVSFKIGQILTDCAKLNDSEEAAPPLGAYLEEHFHRYLQEHVTDPQDEEIYRELFDWHVRFQVIDNSCLDLSRLSAKRWGDYVCQDDEAHSNLKFGYQSLVEAVVEGLPNGCVRCDTEVVGIGGDLQGGVVLRTQNGGLVACDHLVLTPSLGVLKQFNGLEHVLPEKMMVNVQNMGFANICKIFLFYEEKWWGDCKGFQLLWNQDVVFNEGAEWLRQVTGFDEVLNHDNALLTWVGGASAETVEKLEPQVIGKQCTEFLQKFLLNHSVPLPHKVVRTQWHSDPFVRGSYCHISPECDAPDAGIAALKEPVCVQGVPRVLLAGEAVHQSHYSTTHGAFESGLEQAQVICDFIDSQSCK